jgi:hypothetical protein
MKSRPTRAGASDGSCLLLGGKLTVLYCHSDSAVLQGVHDRKLSLVLLLMVAIGESQVAAATPSSAHS